MDETRKNIFIDLILGLVVVVAAVFLMDVFHAQTTRDLFRLLSDCFFLPAAMLLASAGLNWAKNGGVWDGLGFTVKILFARMMPNYESKRITFAEYKEKREEKSSSSIPALVSGLVYLAVAVVFLVLFNITK
jgi:hypothetical protein